MQGRTKDELYLIKLYELAKASGSPANRKDAYVVGKVLGLTEKVVKPMIDLLARANFIKKVEEKDIALTPHGLKLVMQLLENK